MLFLRNSALVLGGYVFIFELKSALKKFLNRGTNNIPLDKLVSRYAYSAEGQALDILDYQETNLFSGEQIEFDNYEIKFNEFIFPYLTRQIYQQKISYVISTFKRAVKYYKA